MYLIHFFNAQGRYQTPIYQQDTQAALEIVFTYKDLVPRIMVTVNDESAFETERGRVVWPELAEEAIDRLQRAFPAAAAGSALGLLPGYLAEVSRTQMACPELAELAYTQLRAAEIPLLAYAACEGLNLLAHGYQPAEAIISKLMEWHGAGD